MTTSDQEKLGLAAAPLADTFQLVANAFAVQYPGNTLGVANTYRPPEAQQAAAAAGKSPFNGTSHFSTHQFFPSRALDFIVRDPAAPDGWVEDGADPRYAWAGEQFELYGLKWGGRWPKPDWDHVQMDTPNPTAGEVLADLQEYESQVEA